MDFSGIRTERENDDPQTEDIEDTLAPRKSGCFLQSLRIFAGLLLIALLGISLLPTLLSSARVRRAVEARANAALAPKKITLGDWSFSWFSRIRLDNITYQDPAQGLSCKIAAVQIDRGLFGLLPIGALDFTLMTIQKPEITVLLPEPVAAPSAAPAKQVAEKPAKSLSLPLSDLRGKIAVRDGTLTIGKKGQESFSIPAYAVDVAIDSYTAPIDVHVNVTLGTGAMILKAKSASIANCLEQPPRILPDELSLTLQKIDLATFAPLVRSTTSGNVLSLSGLAEGALKVNLTSATQMKITSGLMVSRFSITTEQATTQHGDIALLADVDCALPSFTVKRLECVSPWIKAQANGEFLLDVLSKRVLGTLEATAHADLTATLRDLAPLMGQTVSSQAKPGALDIALKIASDAKGFDIQKVQLTAPFAAFTAQGRIDRLQSKGHLDLTTLARDFRPFVTNMPPMVGRIGFELTTALNEKTINLNSTLDFAEVVAELKPGQRMVVPQGKATFSAAIPFEHSIVRNELRNGRFSFQAGDTTMAAQWLSLAAAKAADANAPAQLALPVISGFTWSSQSTLRSLRTQIGGFLPPALYTRLHNAEGTLLLNATAASQDNQLKANVNVGMNDLRIPLTNSASFAIPSLKSTHQLAVNGVEGRFSDHSDIISTLTYSVGDEIRFAENALAIKFACNGPLDASALTIDTLTIASELLSLDSSAQLSDLKNRALMHAQGNVALDFEQVTKILAAQGVNDVALTGRTKKTFAFAAPLAGGLPTFFSDGSMNLALGLQSLTWMGLHAGPSDITATLNDGVLKASYAPTLNKGKLNVTPELRMERGNLSIQFPPKMQLLSSVELTQEILEKMVIKSNPFFSGSTIQKGLVSLRFDEFTFVTNQKTPDRGIAIDATLEAKDLTIQPGPQMTELLSTVKLQTRELHAEEMTVHATVRKGLITVDPFTIHVDKYPLTFGGSVGFDNTINYYVDLPITDRILGKASDIAILQNKRIRIPMTGTLDRPRVDYSKFASEIGRTITDAVKETTTDFFKNLRDQLRKQ